MNRTAADGKATMWRTRDENDNDLLSMVCYEPTRRAKDLATRECLSQTQNLQWMEQAENGPNCITRQIIGSQVEVDGECMRKKLRARIIYSVKLRAIIPVILAGLVIDPAKMIEMTVAKICYNSLHFFVSKHKAHYGFTVKNPRIL